MRSLHVIAGLCADVVALQEADFRLGQRPSALPRDAISHHTGLVPLPVAANTVSLGWHGIALLARPELAHGDIHRIDLPGLEPRGALVVDFAMGLRVVGVHLGLLRRDRRAQMAHIRARLGDLAPMPTVIMGDFNEWAREKGFEAFSDYTVLAPGRTYPARLPVGQLDRMAHCSQVVVTPRPVPRPAKGPHASDHLPIVAEVGIKDL